MSSAESISFWLAVFLYSFAFILFVFAFLWKREKAIGYALVLTLAGFGGHTAALIIRWLITAHPPVMQDYENAVFGAWFIVLFTLLIQYRRKRLKLLGIVTVPFSLLMIGYGISTSPSLEPIIPSLRTPWLYVHILFAWLAYGAYTISFAVAVLYLLKERATRKRLSSAIYQRLPDLDILDELTLRYVILGFITDAVMIAAGSIWASQLWGSYWSWDPVETWSLFSWLVYGLGIHLRIFYKWKGSKFAWLVVFAIIFVIISFWGINFISRSIHSLTVT